MAAADQEAAVAAFKKYDVTMLPVVNSVVWRDGRSGPIIRNAYELLGLAALLFAFFVTLQVRPEWLLTPVALFLGAAVLFVFSALNLVVAATAMWPQGPRARRLDDLLVPGTLAVLLAVVELSILALFRIGLERFAGVDMRTYLS